MAAPGAGAGHPHRRRRVDTARQVAERLRAAGLRVELDDSSDRMNAKIRAAQLQKIPYMLVIGDREVEEGTVSVRLRTNENLGAMAVADFITRATGLVATRDNEAL